MAEIKEPKKNSYTQRTDEASRPESWATENTKNNNSIIKAGLASALGRRNQS
jgi:hypothetical protein